MISRCGQTRNFESIEAFFFLNYSSEKNLNEGVIERESTLVFEKKKKSGAMLIHFQRNFINNRLTRDEDSNKMRHLNIFSNFSQFLKQNTLIH